MIDRGETLARGETGAVIRARARCGTRPDFGEAVTIRPGEIPVFWACGVTPQAVVMNAKPELAITHSPGCMFVTDRAAER